MDNGEVVITKPRQLADPATLPVIDWSYINPPKYFRAMLGCKKMSFLYSAKGCNGCCAFCFNKTFHHSTYRRRPVQDVLTEIRYLNENFGLDGVFFADELWCRSRDEMKEMCDAFRESGINFHWGCQMRVGILHDEDYKYMFDAGCRWVNYGLETGSVEMQKKIHKVIDNTKIVSTLKACCEAGITPLSNFIFGFPGEKEDQLKDTLQLIKDINPYSTFRTFFFHHIWALNYITNLNNKVNSKPRISLKILIPLARIYLNRTILTYPTLI